MNNELLTLCTYNIHKGYKYSSKLILSDIRLALRELGCDVLCLQEIRGKDNHAYDQFNNQLEFLADDMWPHYSYGKNVVYQHTHHGNAILSKYPIHDSHHVDVTKGPVSKRGLMIGKIKARVYIICVHFGLLASERNYQLSRLLELVNDFVPENAPVIIAGDFNDFTRRIDNGMTYKGFLEVSRVSQRRLFKTFPSRMPVFSLDRIYYKNIQCVSADIMNRSPWNRLSDHCALMASFKIK